MLLFNSSCAVKVVKNNKRMTGNKSTRSALVTLLLSIWGDNLIIRKKKLANVMLKSGMNVWAGKEHTGYLSFTFKMRVIPLSFSSCRWSYIWSKSPSKPAEASLTDETMNTTVQKLQALAANRLPCKCFPDHHVVLRSALPPWDGRFLRWLKHMRVG